MINLDTIYQEYLHKGDKKFRIDDIEEKVIAYGYTDDGKDIDGYYVTTINHTLYFCKQGRFKRKEKLTRVKD
jgi:hypothetical protein|tara:strand:+ start:8595 stop:8810 length:216 start_codon:yes stop_codon:yes gene_type:complete